MRILLCILVLFPAAGCEPGSPTKKFDAESVLECMRAQNSKDDYLLETACTPLGKQKNYNGTWFVGFEESLFKDNYMMVPAGLVEGPDLYEIVVPETVSAKMRASSPGVSLAYQVSLVGRESAVPGLGGRKVLVLDQVISIRPVERNLDYELR